MSKQKRTQRKRLEDIKESREEFLSTNAVPQEPETNPQLKPPGKVDLMARERARQSMIEQKIQQAMNEGAFDNLPGAGKPLNLDKNPYTDPSLDLAHGLLKNNRLAPEWIERDKEIRRKLEAARQQLTRAWQAQQDDPSKERWQAALNRFAEMLDKLNRAIDDFNLLVPILSAQRPRLQVAQEVKRITSRSIPPS